MHLLVATVLLRWGALSFVLTTAIPKPLRKSQCRSPIEVQALPSAFIPVASQALPVGVGIFSLVHYHRNLKKRENEGQDTWRKAQANTREEWAKHVRDTEGWLYAVQTLRNAITVNTFLATTVLSLLTVITGKLWILVNEGTIYQRLQFTAIAGSMLRSAYEFLQSARLMTHAGFMFPVTSDGSKVIKILRKSSIAQWLGLRWLYIGATTIVWTIGGAIPFVAVSLIITQFFRTIDQAPNGTEGVS